MPELSWLEARHIYANLMTEGERQDFHSAHRGEAMNLNTSVVGRVFYFAVLLGLCAVMIFLLWVGGSDGVLISFLLCGPLFYLSLLLLCDKYHSETMEEHCRMYHIKRYK